MTVAVAGAWELGWNTPIKEADLWEYPLREFGVEHWHMAPVSGIQHSLVEEHANLGEFIEEQRRAGGVQIVFVDEQGTTPLREFIHPADVLYVCGKTSASALAAYGRPGELSVRVETAVNQGMPWAHQIITVVLYDRLLKSWR